jgi:hypothetical protein
MAAAPPSTKEQVGAALQTAGQYAGGSTVWTPANAESVGLDPERGFVAKGTPVDAPQPPTPVEPKPPSMAPGLGTVSGAPAQHPSQAKQAQVPEKSPAAEEIKIPGATAVKPAAVDAGSTEEIKIPGATAVKPATTDTAGAAEEIKIPGATAVKPAEQVPAQPQPQPQAQSETQQPTVTYPPIAEDQPDTQEQVKALVQQGHSPGTAQAIVAGQQPKTISGAPPKPQQQTPKPTDTLEAGTGNAVDPRALYSYLLGKFANSGLVGYVPPDGARWGIKTGSAAEWAAFGLAVAKQESDLNTRSTNLADPGGSYGLFQFSQKTQPQFTKGGDQYDPQQSADSFIRAVQHYLANKGSVANLGDIFGSIRRPNEAGQYIAGAQKVAAGGSGKDLVSSGGGGGGGGGEGGGEGTIGTIGFMPIIPTHPPSGSARLEGGRPQLPGSSGGGAAGGGYGSGTSSTAGIESINLSRMAEAALAGAGGAALGSRLFGGGKPQAAQPPEEPGPSPSEVVAKVLAAGGPPPAPGAAPVDLSTMKQANVLGVRTPGAPQLGLPAPPAAPSATPAAPDPSVIKGLMKAGFTFEQANAFAAKAMVSKPGAALAGGASFRKPLKLPAPPPAPSRQPPVAAAKPPPQPPPQPQAPPRPVSPPQAGVAPRGSTVGVPNPKGSEALQGVKLVRPDVMRQHAALLSPDDPRVKKQADGMFKGEHFVPGDPVHDPALAGLPGGHGGRQRQILGEAEQAIAEKRPMHISYISAPQEAEKFPTRESRKIQYDEHSPEARLMGTTEGQLVGHSMIPVSVGIRFPTKAGEPHQSYIQGISTNVLANNFQHVNDKLAGMGRKTPYQQLGQKFFNDLEGYYSNLNAGHTATGRGYVLGTPDHPAEPDRSHVPYKLSRSEADFIGTVINNTAAFAKHSDAEKLRELARINGTLITPEGETNRLRHEIEQHEPGWRQRVLEPSVRSFKTGLVHEVHPTEEHMPATIRPGKEFQDFTRAIARTSERGRPDVPISVSLHHTLQDNKIINQIEREFSEERISEADARARLHAIGEDPDAYRFISGSGGLITPYEENPEAITPEEHDQLKDNLRKQWIGGKMPIEDYRRKTAEVPLPEIPSRRPAATQIPPAEEEKEAPAEAPAPSPIVPKKPKAPPALEPKPPEPEVPEEKPEAPPRGPKEPPAAPTAPAQPEPAKKAAFKNVKPEEFIAQRNKSTRAGFLSELKPEDIKSHKLFTNHEGTVGAAVSPEGDIQNIFNNGGPKGHAAHAIGHAIEQHGGKTLDAYDGFLPDYYRQFGFHETGRMKFNPAFAHNWDTAKQGTPDVVFMAHKGYPEGGHAAAVERTASKDKTKWIPNEQSSRYDDDWDAQKARSRNEAVAGGEKDYRTAGVEQGPEAHPARGTAQPGAGAAPGGTVGPPPAPGDILPPVKKGAKEPPPPRPISAATQKVLGPQPKNKKQAQLWQQAGERLDTQVAEGIPLEVDRDEKGKFKTDPHGKVLYKKTNYDIANSPLLQKQGKALGQALNKKTGQMGMAKPPKDVEDDLGELDPENRLTQFLNPTDRQRVAHLNDISAVDAYADELHKMYKGIEDLPEVMKGKNWYDEAVELLRKHFGAHADLMANLLGATSIGNKVKINFNMAVEAYHQFLRGHYDDAIKLYNQAYDIQQSGKGALMKHVADNGIHTALGQEAPDTDERAMLQWIEHHNLTPRSSNGELFGHNSLQVLKVLAHNWEKEAGGPKAPNFAANLNGRSMQATIDMWAARTMRRLGFEGHTDKPWMIQVAGEKGVNNVDFGLSQLAFKKAAERIGIKPSALQAILWFAEQKEWQKRGWERELDPDERDYRPMLKKYQRPGDISQEQASKYHPSVPELKARLAGGAGGVLKMQGGGFVQPPQPSEVPGLMPQGQTQPAQPQAAQTSAQAQGATQPLNAPAQSAQAPPPAAPTGGAFTPMPQETGQVNIPSGVTRNVRVTHYGYEKPGEPGYDKNSAKGIGDRDNMLTYDPEGITSVALTPSYRLARFGTKGHSTGEVFQVGDRLFRDDDTTSKELKDHRIDVYDPNKEGTGFPDTVRVAEGTGLGRNIPVPPR